jgi:hypothetical protein
MLANNATPRMKPLLTHACLSFRWQTFYDLLLGMYVQIVGIPHALGVVSAGLSFNGSQWPAASTINNALAGYHTAVSATQTAWLNVQIHGEQQGLAAPPADPWAAMRKELLNRANLPPR